MHLIWLVKFVWLLILGVVYGIVTLDVLLLLIVFIIFKGGPIVDIQFLFNLLDNAGRLKYIPCIVYPSSQVLFSPAAVWILAVDHIKVLLLEVAVKVALGEDLVFALILSEVERYYNVSYLRIWHWRSFFHYINHLACNLLETRLFLDLPVNLV